MHVLLEGASALLLVIPLIAVGRAYAHTKSMRLLFAFAAFYVLEVRVIVLLLIHTVFVVDHPFEETVDFATDLAAIVLFTAAFMYDSRWFHGRVPADVA
ncbi:MAG TPA: hypothetical protein VJP06_06160 [Thermoplasmata archaeon]|nr:hypothetical protein [Thermoplasmata archaeon]